MVDRNEFRSGLMRLGVKLSGPEFEACWQYADPRGEGELSQEYFVSGLGEIDPEVDEADKAWSEQDKTSKRKVRPRANEILRGRGAEGSECGLVFIA